MASKFYAVRIGKTPGIYGSWAECKKMVDGYPGAVYKSFQSLEEAKNFANAGGSAAREAALKEKKTPAGKEKKAKELQSTEKPDALPGVYAFVDGSYNAATKVYGFGGYLIHDGKKELLQGSGSDTEMASMRNVSGEILGSTAAVKKALELGLPEVTIYYDYMGIEMWATGSWKRNKQGTIAYYDFMQSVKNQINVHFVKVKGHSGVDGNEEADQLAKKAVGIL